MGVEIKYEVNGFKKGDWVFSNQAAKDAPQKTYKIEVFFCWDDHIDVHLENNHYVWPIEVLEHYTHEAPKKSIMKKILCYIGIHNWQKGLSGSLINPLADKCKRCGIVRVFAGFGYYYGRDAADVDKSKSTHP